MTIVIMQIFTMNNKLYREVFFATVWRGRDSLLFNEISSLEFSLITQDKAELHKWSFQGSWATVFVVTHENDLTRRQALNIATCLMKGNYVKTYVDLDRCESTNFRGIEKTPRH